MLDPWWRTWPWVAPRDPRPEKQAEIAAAAANKPKKARGLFATTISNTETKAIVELKDKTIYEEIFPDSTQKPGWVARVPGSPRWS